MPTDQAMPTLVYLCPGVYFHSKLQAELRRLSSGVALAERQPKQANSLKRLVKSGSFKLRSAAPASPPASPPQPTTLCAQPSKLPRKSSLKGFNWFAAVASAGDSTGEDRNSRRSKSLLSRSPSLKLRSKASVNGFKWIGAAPGSGEQAGEDRNSQRSSCRASTSAHHVAKSVVRLRSIFAKSVTQEAPDEPVVPVDKGRLVLLYSTESRFQWYAATCPRALKDAGLLRLFFDKFPTSELLRDAVCQVKVRPRAAVIMSAIEKATAQASTNKRSITFRTGTPAPPEAAPAPAAPREVSLDLLYEA